MNNPTARHVETTVRAVIALPGLDLPAARMRFEPGEYRVLVAGTAP